MVGEVNITELTTDEFFTDDELGDEEPWDLEDDGTWDDEEALDDLWVWASALHGMYESCCGF